MKSLVLEQSRALRLFTVFILYVAQGIPIGLFWFAIPAWMASNGASAAEVGSVAAMTALPWSLKFVNGFLMDRYSWLAMGRRRVWLIGAQLVMILCLLAVAALQPAVTDIALLGLAGFVVNAATTFQDVAVDGLAVDIMPEDERGRASGMMFGGQAIGISVSTAITGWAIAKLGPSGAYLIAALLVAIVTLYILAFTEREGEKRFPWSAGEAHPRNRAIQLDRWWPILKQTLTSLLRPISILFIPILLIKGLFYGLMVGAGPLLAGGTTGMSEVEITSYASLGNMIAGVLGLTLGGFLTDRLGPKIASNIWFLGWAAFFATVGLIEPQWTNPDVAATILVSWVAFDTLITVASIPIAMRLAPPAIAATQFTIYMAITNFGISLGAILFSRTQDLGGLANLFFVGAGFAILGLVIMTLVKWPDKQVALD